MAEQKVRVGDRYLRGDDERITIAAIHTDPWQVDYLVLKGDNRTPWRATTDLPLPDAWVKVGSGPLTLEETCLSCGKDEREAGQYFCPGCMLDLTENWRGLTPDQITDRIEALKLLADDDNEDGAHG